MQTTLKFLLSHLAKTVELRTNDNGVTAGELKYLGSENFKIEDKPFYPEDVKSFGWVEGNPYITLK